jgi:starch-binding outer membrane protein, SusD/RagB family
MRTLKRSIKVALVAGLPMMGMTGCTDFLDAGEAQLDPNRPTVATRNQRLVSVLSSNWAFQNGEYARLVQMWMQQFTGTDRQYQTLGTYEVSEGTYGGAFDIVYAGGGLLDIRKIQSESRAANDRLYLGIAQTLEAMMIGTAASLWGDIPYTEALKESTPKLDGQMAVYDKIQLLLDTAITNLQSGVGLGPGSADLVYQGSGTKWAQLANTLKARFHMHTAEVRGASAYNAALTATNSGISTPANNFIAIHTSTPGEMNMWYQFIEIQRQGYISSGKFLVDLLNSRSDPRLARYWDPNSSGAYVGAAPGATFSSTFATLDAARNDPGFDQPIVTRGENLLIAAEAAQRTGNDAAARTHLNAARALDGLPPVSATLTGTALLQEIMTEKYIQLFQNIEVYNDWKRTCYPNLSPAPTKTEIPARFLYPVDERQTNSNVPSVAQQPSRNANDPAGGSLFNAAACNGA